LSMRKIVIVCAALAACHPKPKPAAALSPETPPTLRLPAAAKPLRYTLDLTIDPTQDEFSGRVDIELEMKAPVETLWLNGTDLEISEASLDGVPAKVVTVAPDFVGFRFAKPTQGRLLRVVYRGKAALKESQGVF